MGQILYME